jgi:DNA uptake protein ComE-like DNA-binding protein
MDFYKAKAILEYRRKRGNIKGLSRLSLFEEFTEKDLQRLSPYLSFE